MRSVLFVLATLLFPVLAFGQAPSQPEEASAHLLVTLDIHKQSARIVDARRVELPLPKLKTPEAQLWTAEVRSSAGELLYESAIPPANVLRGEFKDKDGKQKGVHLKKEKYPVALRLPLLANASKIILLGAAGTVRDNVDPAESRRPVKIIEVDYPAEMAR